MNLIVAADKNWAIGKDGDLLWHLPEDMKFFRTTTTGNVVIMGRKTLDSFPGGKPLKNRDNVVLTANPDFKREGAIVVDSVEEALRVSEELSEGKKIYVIGGGRIYKEFLPYCELAHVTRVNASFDADTFFPNLDEMEEWELMEKGEEKEQDGLTYSFDTYKKISK